jgi:hypothetical protein
VAGFIMADKMDLAQGHADAMGMMGDIGGGVGLAGSYLLSSGTDSDDDAIWAAGVLTSFAGVWAGHRLARREHMTRGDVGVFRAAALLGAWTGFATVFALNPDRPGEVREGKPETAGALAGAAVGLVAGRLLTRGREFSNADGTIVSIGALGGGLLGAGLGYLATPNGNSERGVFLAGAAGALVGFGLTYATTQAEARHNAELGAWSLQVNPLAFAMRDASVRVPAVTVGLRF